MSNVSQLLNEVANQIGEQHVLREPEPIAPYLRDWRGDFQSRAAAVLRPANTAEVSAIVTECAAAKIGMVPIGGNTGLVGGAVAREDQVLISLERLNRVRAVDTVGATISLEAGCVLADAQAVCAQAQLLLPLSLAAEGTCQIGGNLSTGAGGLNVVRYGTVREQVLGLEVVLPDGQVLNQSRGLRKDVAGLDLKQWFIGAEGTLGVITAAVLRLFPLPTERLTLWLCVPDNEDVLAVFSWFRTRLGSLLTAFEMLSASTVEVIAKYLGEVPPVVRKDDAKHVLVEIQGGALELDIDRILDGLSGLAEECRILDSVVASSLAQREQFWRWRHSASDAQKLAGACIKHDIGLPIDRISDFLGSIDSVLQRVVPDCRVFSFGHVGDGNLHFTVAQPHRAPEDWRQQYRESVTESVHRCVLEHGGTVSAEHGIGLLKRDALAQQIAPTGLRLMRELKTALDPHNLMNPGKVL